MTEFIDINKSEDYDDPQSHRSIYTTWDMVEAKANDEHPIILFDAVKTFDDILNLNPIRAKQGMLIVFVKQAFFMTAEFEAVCRTNINSLVDAFAPKIFKMDEHGWEVAKQSTAYKMWRYGYLGLYKKGSIIMELWAENSLRKELHFLPQEAVAYLLELNDDDDEMPDIGSDPSKPELIDA